VNGSADGESGSADGENGSADGENGSADGENGSVDGENGSADGEVDVAGRSDVHRLVTTPDVTRIARNVFNDVFNVLTAAA
jgi:hypothetical protein